VLRPTRRTSPQVQRADRLDARRGRPRTVRARPPGARDDSADVGDAHLIELDVTPQLVLRELGSPSKRFKLRVVLMCLLYRLFLRAQVVRVLARGGGERELEICVVRHQPQARWEAAAVHGR
jgi:hypothetical protein